MARGFLLGVLATLVFAAVLAYFSVVQGCLPANADGKPFPLEAWAAHRSLHAALDREAPKGANPVALSDANLAEGLDLYEKNCMVCHGASAGRPSAIALGLYQEAPQLAKDGVEDDPEGVTFWKVKHGIRLTGMPGFGKSLDDTQVWKVALFLKHMDSLPPSVRKVWEKAP